MKVDQDLGFLGAMIAGVGGLLVGVSTLRHHRRRAGAAPWLLLLTLPLGFLAIALLATMGAHEDYLGLPLTMLYGGAWIALGEVDKLESLDVGAGTGHHQRVQPLGGGGLPPGVHGVQRGVQVGRGVHAVMGRVAGDNVARPKGFEPLTF